MSFFGSSGIREKVSLDFFALSFKVGLALGSSHTSAVVGWDTRTSSDALRHIITSGILLSGAQVYEAGVVPTPTLAFASRNFSCGVMLTASHNPPEYNGIKILNPDGSAFDSRQRLEIEQLVSQNSLNITSWDKIKASLIYSNAIEEHIEHILHYFPPLKLKVIIDCGSGATSLAAPYLLKRLGCEVIAINSYPSGYFPRGMEPIPENLSALMKTVKAEKASLGIAYDGDGDRMMVIDEEGKFIPGDKLLAIFAQSLKARRIITTVDASMLVEELDFEVERTKVGDPFVSEELKRGGGEFGGEPSGCWVFPQVSLCPDGLYASAKILQIAAERKLSKLASEIPSYPLFRGSVLGRNLKLAEIEKKLKNLNPLSINTKDGLRLSFKDGWLLIRPSGTEPKVRVTAEAKSVKRAKELYNIGIKVVNESLRG